MGNFKRAICGWCVEHWLEIHRNRIIRVSDCSFLNLEDMLNL